MFHRNSNRQHSWSSDTFPTNIYPRRASLLSKAPTWSQTGLQSSTSGFTYSNSLPHVQTVECNLASWQCKQNLSNNVCYYLPTVINLSRQLNKPPNYSHYLQTSSVRLFKPKTFLYAHTKQRFLLSSGSKKLLHLVRSFWLHLGVG